MKNSFIEQEKWIMQEVAAGNHQAFKSLIDQYKGYLFSISLKILQSDAYANDLIQEVFLKIWLNKEKLLEIENFKAYLSTIASNHIYSLLRKKMHEQHYIVEYANSHQQDSDLDHTEMHNESFLRSDLEEAMSCLTPQQKKVFQLSRIEGFKHDEIATMLKISKETVKKHIMASLQAMRKQMNRDNHISDMIILFFLFFLK